MKQRISSLTSMRFFAAIMIVIGHGSQIPAFKDFNFTLFNVGNSVSFFYVLSGFILTYNYYSMRAMQDYRKYITARVARVWPLHLVMLVAVIILLDYDTSDKAILFANAFAIQSWFPYSTFFYSFNAVSWSISTELTFYVMFPFFLFLLKNNAKLLLVLATAFLATPLFISLHFELPVKPSPDYISSSFLLYINPICRSVEFISGMIACKMFVNSRQISGGGLGTLLEISSLAIFVLFMFISNRLWFVFKDGFFAAFFGWLATAGAFIFIAAFIFSVSYFRGGCSRFLSNKVLVYLGEISFSMYMCHQVILNFINKYYSNEAAEHGAIFYLIYLIAVVGGSSILYHCVEVPARKVIRKALSKRKNEMAISMK